MKPYSSSRARGFTLLETVIAIGVLAVLLTGFMIVFAPAAAGIRKSINVQEADRLASTLEQELVTVRKGQENADIRTGFDKAFLAIKNSTGPNGGGSDTGNPTTALLVYQYRGDLTSVRSDGTLKPLPDARNKVPGKDYVVQSMMRVKNDANFLEDLKAVEGSIYMVKCVQLVFDSGGLKPVDHTNKSLRGNIMNPKPAGATETDYKPGPFDKAADYPEAVIAFTADFFAVPSKSESFFNSGAGFTKAYASAKSPVFTRNLAVRR
jgi:prepilin-type N-terminal cleavage/methylation domain-containing protein